MPFTESDREALRAMREELEEQSREEARQKSNLKGKQIDQIELCYKQYVPPQIEVTNV